jgi:hypothetical protein
MSKVEKTVCDACKKTLKQSLHINGEIEIYDDDVKKGYVDLDDFDFCSLECFKEFMECNHSDIKDMNIKNT